MVLFKVKEFIEYLDYIVNKIYGINIKMRISLIEEKYF